MAAIPEPKYDRDVNILIQALKAALLAIQAELMRLDVSDMSRANSTAALAEIAVILREFNEESAAWVAEHIPSAATDGVVRAMLDLGVTDTAEKARRIAKFNRINQEFVATAVADTQADILAVTQNIERRVRTAIRQVTAESMRGNITKGINGRKTISRDILEGMQRTLGDVVNTGIVDSAGRRWNPKHYVDMLTRTKLMQTHREATVNEAIGRGSYYARVSRHGATDACAQWEGRIVKLTPDAPGEYPYVGDISRRDLFHPCCKHVLSPFRSPEIAKTV